MAVEPTVLAAYIASVYDKVGAFQDESAPDRAQQFGWLFLEKMVQLPVVVPRPTPQQAASYLTDLLPPVPHPSTPESADPGTDSTPRDRPALMSQQQSPVAEQPAAVSSPDAAQRRGGVDESDTLDLLRGGVAMSVSPLAARERLARNLASEKAYHDACEWAAKNLLTELNPRKLKRLLAMIQLYALIGNRLGYLSTSDPQVLTSQLRHVGVLAALNIRWPHLVDNLLAPESGDPDAPLVIEQLQQLRSDAPSRRDRSRSRPGHPHHPRRAPAGRRDQFPEELLRFTSKHRDALDMIKQLMTLRPAEEIAG